MARLVNWEKSSLSWGAAGSVRAVPNHVIAAGLLPLDSPTSVAVATAVWTAVYFALLRLWPQCTAEWHCRVLTFVHAFLVVVWPRPRCGARTDAGPNRPMPGARCSS